MNKMENMEIKQLVVSMSLPIIISMVIQALYNIVDSIFVAKISSDAQIYSGLWDSMMKLEDLLYNAFFYCGDFKGKYCVGVFLPFTHFEHNLEKNIEVSNSILYECIQKMLND